MRKVKGIYCEHVSDRWWACNQESLAAQGRIDSEETFIGGSFCEFPERNPSIVGEENGVISSEDASILVLVS